MLTEINITFLNVLVMVNAEIKIKGSCRSIVTKVKCYHVTELSRSVQRAACSLACQKQHEVKGWLDTIFLASVQYQNVIPLCRYHR